MKRSLLLLPAALLLASCSSGPTKNISSVANSGTARGIAQIAASGNPEAAARALLKRKKLAYLRDPMQLANDLKKVQSDFRLLMDVLRGNAGKQWGKKEARLPDRTHYVKYTQGYLSRAVVDFDRGEITVELLDMRGAVHNPRLIDAANDLAVTVDDDVLLALGRRDRAVADEVVEAGKVSRDDVVRLDLRVVARVLQVNLCVVNRRHRPSWALH